MLQVFWKRGKVYPRGGSRGHTLSTFIISSFTPVCVLILQYYLLPSCVPRFVWTAIKNQPIGTAGRRARAPGARLARAANHTPGNQSPRTHGVNIRASSGLEGGGTTRPVRERESDIEREVERENKRMREEARKQRRTLLYWIVLQREFAVWQVYIHQNRTKR